MCPCRINELLMSGHTVQQTPASPCSVTVQELSKNALQPWSLHFSSQDATLAAHQNTRGTIYSTQRASDRRASVCEYFSFLIVSELCFSVLLSEVSNGPRLLATAMHGDRLSPRFLTPNKESSGCHDQSPSQRVKEEEGVKRLVYTILLWPLIVFTPETASASD